MKTLRFFSGLFLSLGTIVLVLTTALPAAASASAQAPHGAAASNGRCAGADSVTQSMRQLKRTVLCLHNRDRRARGLSSLRWNHDLSQAAGGHGHDMVRRHYFEHRSPGGADHIRRAAAAGYGKGAGCWSAGENLLFAEGRLTPRQMLTGWMGSPEHRRNVLRTRWHEFGLSVTMTSPSGHRGGMTIVAMFGTRSLPGC